MDDKHLATYLNDHLAGSSVALELLEHLESTHAGSDVGRSAATLRADIAADRMELKELMRRLHVDESRTRKASAWLTEKLTEIKLRLDDPQGGSLRLLEAFEALSLGIEGKRLLWRALANAAKDASALGSVDYERLIRRAEEQRSRVETMRLDAAKEALTPTAAVPETL
jgi:hypothetical protein